MSPSILYFYLLRRFVPWLLGVAFVLASLALLGDMVETGRVASKLGSPSFAVVLSAFRLPSLMGEIMPFVILLATMGCLLQLSQNHELVVMRMSGMPAWQFIMPLALLAAFVGVLQITLLDPLGATGLQRYKEDYTTQNLRPEFSFAESGVWLHESDSEGSRILRAENINTFQSPGGRQQAVLGDVNFRVLDARDNYLYRIEARTARLQGERWQLTQARIIRPSEQIVYHDIWQLPTNLKVDDLNHYYRPSDILKLWELPNYIDNAKAKGADTKEHLVRLNRLLATPLTLVAMVMLAACFSIPTMRVWSAGRVIGLTLGGGLVFFFVSASAINLAETNLVAPLAAAWVPPVLAIVGGVILLTITEDA